MKKQYQKGQYIIFASIAQPGIKVHNFLEDADYTTSEKKPVILTGTRGEQWTVTLQKLAETYNYADGTPIDIEALPHVSFAITPIVGENAPIIFAELTTEQEKIETSWGEVLTANRDGIPHGDGDYIVYADDGTGNPNPNNRWVVNGLVFVDTYVEVQA